MKTNLRAYMGFSISGGAEEGACLVFAHNAKEARKLTYGVINGWFGENWIDTGVKWLKGDRYEHLFVTEGDPAKLAADIPHVIKSPEACKRCELWGCERDKNGICLDCLELEEEFEPVTTL